MRILGIDPGPSTSGYVIYDAEARRVVRAKSEVSNIDLVTCLEQTFYDCDDVDVCVIEMIHNQGRTIVGQTVFDTCVWIGRFVQAWDGVDDAILMLRSRVKMAICGSMRAKDANIRAALTDLLGAPGTKKNPGPTYGVTGHAWQALAVCVAYCS